MKEGGGEKVNIYTRRHKQEDFERVFQILDRRRTQVEKLLWEFDGIQTQLSTLRNVEEDTKTILTNTKNMLQVARDEALTKLSTIAKDTVMDKFTKIVKIKRIAATLAQKINHAHGVLNSNAVRKPLDTIEYKAPNEDEAANTKQDEKILTMYTTDIKHPSTYTEVKKILKKRISEADAIYSELLNVIDTLLKQSIIDNSDYELFIQARDRFAQTLSYTKQHLLKTETDTKKTNRQRLVALKELSAELTEAMMLANQLAHFEETENNNPKTK